MKSERRRNTLALGLALAAFGVVWVSPDPWPVQGPEPTPNATPPLAEPTIRERAGRVPNPPAPSFSAPAPIPRVVELAPAAQVLREEAARAPHRPPRALLRFAEELGRRVDPALGHEAAARLLMPELSECVRRSELSSPVQAICLNGADSLAHAHAALAPAYRQLRDSAPVEARRLLELRDRMSPVVTR